MSAKISAWCVLAAALAVVVLPGCSAHSSPAPAATVTVTSTPSLSRAEILAACEKVYVHRFERSLTHHIGSAEPATCAGLAHNVVVRLIQKAFLRAIRKKTGV